MNEFVEKHKHDVLQATQYSEFLPSVMMAQAIIESGWGNSELASIYNNYFGEKTGKDWKGETVDYQTDEFGGGKYYTITDTFRVYPSKYAGFKGHIDFLNNYSRYDRVLKKETAEGQARALQQAGYATAPNYADILIRTINRYNLKELDDKVHKMKFLNKIIVVFGLLYAGLLAYRAYMKYVKKV